MFYFEKINNKNILKSDLIKDAEAFFTTRDICICDKGVNVATNDVAICEITNTSGVNVATNDVANCEITNTSGINVASKQNKNSKILNRVQNDRIFEINNNKKIIAEYLKISEKNLISPTQTHSANIDVAIETRHDYPDCDALILTEKNLGIFLNFADCTPIILYDKKLNIGAVAHAGWRGTAQKIAPLTVEKLVSDYGSKPSDIIALIGPTIGFCCYNVGEEVYKKLSETVENFEGLYEIRQGDIFVDLKNINKRQLEEIGVKEIDVCPYCTVHHNDKFFSYRNENATTKRHSAVLKLI